ncbi:hypothetical protein [Dactylosporangium sp. CA-092794]|uniref:hypothetical protein n=1 Tax=Dactylosporangium sp. CA-092794 TaxID=3239929 RepID=UPI003D8BDA4E
MRLRQFRLLVAGEVTPGAADALFGRAADLCVEVLPPNDVVPVAPGSGGPVGAGGEPGGADWPAGRVAWVAFDRDAPSLLDAVVSGVRDLDVAGLAIESALADDPLVTLETIGERLDRPAVAVRSWALPEPVFAHPRRPVYDWPEVAEWLEGHRGYRPPDEEAALEAVTLTLRVRALGPRLERMTALRSLLQP